MLAMRIVRQSVFARSVVGCGVLGCRLAFLFFRRIKTIADIAHGTDHMLVFAAQLGAKTTDMHVDVRVPP